MMERVKPIGDQRGFRNRGEELMAVLSVGDVRGWSDVNISDVCLMKLKHSRLLRPPLV